jgi:2-dehydropantoate 2-reductase
LTKSYAAEIAAVAAAVGVELPPSIGDQVLAELRVMPPGLGSSITFDAEAGRELEWEARNGVVQRLGRRHRVPTPISDLVVPLLASASERSPVLDIGHGFRDAQGP